jgi:hypothetical protein
LNLKQEIEDGEAREHGAGWRAGDGKQDGGDGQGLIEDPAEGRDQE